MSDPLIVETIRNFYPEVEAVYLFGSHGTGDEQPDSDVDIALLFPPAQAKSLNNLALSECRHALENKLHKTVDLINLRAVHTVFQHEIIHGGRIIYKQNDYLVDTFEMLVMSLYQKLNEERAGILEEISKTGRIIQS